MAATSAAEYGRLDRSTSSTAARLQTSVGPPAAPAAFRPMVAFIDALVIDPAAVRLATWAPSTYRRMAAPSNVAATWWYWPSFGSGVGLYSDRMVPLTLAVNPGVPRGRLPGAWKKAAVGS